MSRTYQTQDGITVTRRTVESGTWDEAIRVSHPKTHLTPETFFAGGEPIADTVTARLLAEIRRHLAR